MKVWAYIHPELNILCCAVLPEAVPPGIQAIEFEVESPDDVVYDGNQIRLKTYEEKLNERKQRKLQELKTYVASLLQPTDYVVVRIAEAQSLDDFAKANELLQKYSQVLEKRQRIREWNERIKQAIKEAKTLEELERIKIEFEG